ncbi:MAG: hypothetical protein KDB14_33750 [Planctomycetales bacterium]|nr:hypothetical protein [Planctomycetales bacterium]
MFGQPARQSARISQLLALLTAGSLAFLHGRPAICDEPLLPPLEQMSAGEDDAPLLPPLERLPAGYGLPIPTARHLLVLPGKDRPLFVRVDVLLLKDGKTLPLDHFWEHGVREQFDKLDTNGDGRVDDRELSFAIKTKRTIPQVGPSALSMFTRMVAKQWGLGSVENRPAPGVDLEQFAKRESTEQSAIRTRGASSGARVDRLWETVDRNRDQQLDAAELELVAQQLKRLDTNRNGLLEDLELAALDNPMTAQNRSTTTAAEYAGRAGWLTCSDADRVPLMHSSDSLGARLATRYDNASFLADPRWAPLIERHLPEFDPQQPLDSAGWAMLLEDEALPWDVHCRVLIDAEYRSPTNGRPPMKSGIELVSAQPGVRTHAGPNWVAIQGNLVEARLTLGAIGYDPLDNAITTFATADADKNDYIDKQESTRYYPLNVMFDEADLDDNKMLYKDELQRFIDEVRLQASLSTDVAIAENGRQLFASLDLNGDRIVDRSERQAASETLAQCDRDQSGSIESSELCEQYLISFSIGRPEFLGQFSIASQQSLPTPSPAEQGPDWFRLLDRNRDGMLERAEYPGRGAAFKKLDTDGSGAISAAEAAKVQ